MDDEEKITSLIADENRRAIPAELMTPVRSVDAGADGDCFYYSVYDALQAHRLLERVTTHLRIPNTKEEFVNAIRALISDRSDAELLKLYRQICELHTSEYNSREDFESHLEESAHPSWLLKLLRETFLRYDFESHECIEHANDSVQVLTFIREGKRLIRTRGSYTSNIEPFITKQLLNSAGIYLDIKNRKWLRLLNIQNRIVLRNMMEGHFQYFRFTGSGRSVDDTFTVVTRNSNASSASLRGALSTATAPATVAATVAAANNASVKTPTKVPVPPPKVPVPPPKVPVPPPKVPVPPTPPANSPIPAKAPTPPANGPISAKAPASGPVMPLLTIPKPASKTARNTKIRRTRTSKIDRQILRVRAAYQYVLDEIDKYERSLAGGPE